MPKLFSKSKNKSSVTLFYFNKTKYEHYAVNLFFAFFFTILKSKNENWTLKNVHFFKMDYRIKSKKNVTCY